MFLKRLRGHFLKVKRCAGKEGLGVFEKLRGGCH